MAPRLLISRAAKKEQPPAAWSCPSFGLGLATQMLSARDAVLGFAAVLLALVAVISRGLLRQGARQPAKLSPVR